MEYNENPNEINEIENEEEEETGTMKQWFQDNLRIIISVLIVVIIAAGIYSYSNRTIAPTSQEEISQEEEQGNVAGDENESQENIASTDEQKQEKTQATQTPSQQKNISSTATSQETEKSFIETAARGDGTTKLARRALANYLEKNSDSSLTPEHKIYIEDYLRKNIGFKGNVKIGTSVEFSKDLIQQAISKSKTLNENQLQNLHKYAVRVPSLS